MDTSITASLIKAVSGEFDTETVFKLSLCRMNIRHIENMHMCPNLSDLNLSGNDITHVTGLESCTALRKLTLTSNKVAFFEGILQLPSLEHLFVQDNKVDDTLEVLKLTQLQSLKTLYFKNNDNTMKNPVCDHPAYRTIIIGHLKKLTNLDGERLNSADAYSEVAPELKQESTVAKFEIPQTEKWLKEEDFGDAFSDIDAFLKQSEAKFAAVVSEAKKLNSNAMALLSHYN